ncbi:MAG: hypothetical protein NDJ89_16080 [Oligoflexia bacterium]|nr:hypothetical protein [Oligoflexia bacterium]
MRKIMNLALGLLLVAQAASAAKLEAEDLQGRLLVVDQSGGIQGVLVIKRFGASQNVSFSGQISGDEIECAGTGNFDESRQILVVSARCRSNDLAAFELDLSRTEIPVYLNNGLSSARFLFATRESTKFGFTQRYFGSVDVKRLY